MARSFYNLHLDDNETGAVAEAPDDIDFSFYFNLHLHKDLPWEFIIDEGVVEDYLANDVGFPMLSPKLKKIFESYKTVGQHWTKATVYDSRTKEYLNYSIISYREKADVINTEETTYQPPGLILVPVFSLKKIGDLQYFPQPDKYDFNLVISGDMRMAMVSSGITGVSFSKAHLSK